MLHHSYRLYNILVALSNVDRIFVHHGNPATDMSQSKHNTLAPNCLVQMLDCDSIPWGKDLVSGLSKKFNTCLVTQALNQPPSGHETVSLCVSSKMTKVMLT